MLHNEENQDLYFGYDGLDLFFCYDLNIIYKGQII
jgi:hypothetical protein